MSNEERAVLFDMVKRHVTLVDFSRSEGPGFDLYTTRPSAVHRRAMVILVDAGLARPVEWHGLTCYQLDDAARATLGG